MKFIDFHTHHPKAASDKTLSFYCHADLKKPLPENVQENKVYFTAGLHPWFLPANESGDESSLEDLWPTLLELLRRPNCLGLGECGLDRLRGPEFTFQQLILDRQLKLAKENQTPMVVFHCVRAYPECLKAIKESGYRGNIIFHDFSANPETTKQILAFENCYFSLGKALERPSFIEKTLPHLPLERVFVETDDEENLSIEVRYRQLSQAKGLALEEITTSLYKNAQVILGKEKT